MKMLLSVLMFATCFGCTAKQWDDFNTRYMEQLRQENAARAAYKAAHPVYECHTTGYNFGSTYSGDTTCEQQ